MASSACCSVSGFPSILFEAYELFFLEFFLSLFIARAGSFTFATRNLLSSMLLMRLSMPGVTAALIMTGFPSGLFITLHYYFTIFHYMEGFLQTVLLHEAFYVINLRKCSSRDF